MSDKTGQLQDRHFSKDKLLSLLMISTEVVYSMSPDWRVMYALESQDFLTNTFEPDDHWLDKYIHPDDQACVREAIAHCIATKSMFELESRVLRADGSIGWTNSRAIPQFDDKGNITEWIGTASDITERKNAEQSLHESQATLEGFYNSSPFMMGVAELKDDTIIAIYGNEAVGHFFSHPSSQLPGHTESELGAPDDVNGLWLESYRRSQHDGKPVRFEYLHPGPHGLIWLSATVSYIGQGANGRPRFSFIAEEITERKKAEEALRRSEERQAFLLKLSDALRPLSSPQDVHATVTQMTMELLNSDRCYYCEIEDQKAIIRQDASRGDLPTVVGVYPLDVLPIHKSLVDAGLPFVVSDVHTTSIVDESLRQLCIQLKVISYIDVPVIKDDHPVGILCVTQNVPREWTDTEIEMAVEVAERTWAAVEHARIEHELRESEARARDLVEKLEEANRNKNRFISVLSHELRNPLATIVLAQALLKRLPPDSEKAKRTQAMEERQTALLTRMVEDLLDVTRISEDKIQLKLAQLDLIALVQQVVSDIGPSFDDKGITLRVELPAETICVEADSMRLAQSVGNLLHNALKFSLPGSAVTIEAAIDTDRTEAMVRVSDQGAGIEPENLEHIFEPFTQVDQALARTQGGLGLGLSIVKGMVELHGGRVEAESEGLGRGATFTIHLPLR